jgi:mannosyltransferase OCH1-like enzyme
MINCIVIFLIIFIVYNLLKKKDTFSQPKNYVWLYWEDKKGSSKPDYLKLCEETIKKKLSNYQVIILNPNNLNKYLKNVNPNLHKIKEIAHKADYIRMLATYQYGGFWFDMDTIFLDNIDSWNDKLKEYDIVWFGMNAYGVNKHNPFIKNVLNKIESKINKSSTFNWREIGQDIIDPELKKYKKIYPNKFYKLHPTEVWFMSFRVDNKNTGFISKNQKIFDKNFKKTHKIVMLHNKLYPSKFKNMTREEILNDNMIISKLFKQSLK